MGKITARRNNPATIRHMGQCGLGRDKHRTHIDINRAVKLLDTEFVNRCNFDDPGIVHQNIDLSKLCRRLMDCSLNLVGIAVIGLYRQGRTARRLNLADHIARPVWRADIGKDNCGPVAGQTFCDGGSNATASAGNKGNFSCEGLHSEL